MLKPYITNICISFKCMCKIDLCKIYENEKFQTPIRYSPKKFPGLRVRLIESKTTALIFGSGYVSIIGAKSNENAKQSSIEIINFLNKYEPLAKINNLKINNICGSANFYPINLNDLVSSYPLIASYEIELFPALKLRFGNKIFTIHHMVKYFLLVINQNVK
jgi:TATA-box binding protein (TBP) (component of TFIID and TFIIIB)